MEVRPAHVSRQPLITNDIKAGLIRVAVSYYYRALPLSASHEESLAMRLGYFTMPMHPAHRPSAQTLQEDREAIILADKLGFYDAFVGEHLTEKSENVTNSFIFLATL